MFMVTVFSKKRYANTSVSQKINQAPQRKNSGISCRVSIKTYGEVCLLYLKLCDTIIVNIQTNSALKESDSAWNRKPQAKFTAIVIGVTAPSSWHYKRLWSLLVGKPKKLCSYISAAPFHRLVP